jgi:predicted glutamine amidotransferase
MCELLALSTSQPGRLTFSLHSLASHGAVTGAAHDGWGVAFYQGADVALFREPSSAADSALVRHLESHGPSTNLAISHIRHATRGDVQLSNTQPFVRELGGNTHVFAHNGDLPGISDCAMLVASGHRPVGQTDSELAFCALLTRLRPLWEQADPPSVAARMAVLAAFAADLRQLGPANFLYADGDALFVHSHKRIQRSTGRIGTPGLWSLQRQCPATEHASMQLEGVALAGDGARIALILASVPLNDEHWQPMAEGELLAVRGGAVLMRLAASNGAPIPDEQSHD